MPSYRQYLYPKITAPTVNDDTLDGYLVGDIWLDTTNDRIYQAIDVTAAAAIWIETFQLNNPQNRYHLSVTVSANNLTVALKTMADTDPSATEPIYIQIGGTIRKVTAATSITLAAGTNWFNAGGAELATKEIDYFVYAVYDSNSSIVALAPARISHGQLVSDFSATTTNEKHLGNYANYTVTDSVAVIGRFAATLSAGAGYTWTVPTFTNINLKHEPVYESRWLDWTPTTSASGSLTWTSISVTFAKYRVARNKIDIKENISGTLGGSASTTLAFTLPWQVTNTTPPIFGNTASVTLKSFTTAGTPDQASIQKYDASNYATSGSCAIVGYGGYEI